MKEPRNYKETQVGWEPVAPGGHRCVIRKVTETRSQNGNEMIIIEFDMHQTDTQPMYFSNQYISDQKAGRTGDKLRWRGVSYWATDENVEGGTKRLKQFNTAVTDSNPEQELTARGWRWNEQDKLWRPDWQRYGSCFEGLLVGIVFREEDYTKDDGSSGWTVKPVRYCNFNKAFEQKIPERKTNAPAAQPYAQQQPGQWGNAPVNAQGYWQPQRQPSTQMAYMQQGFAQPQQPQYQQQSFAPQQFQQPQYQQQFQQAPPMAQAAQEGFMQIPPDALNDEGLPFN